MKITVALLSSIASPKASKENIQSIVIALERYGDKLGLNQPHRLAQYLAQIAHESGGFQYDAEVWGKDGGTAAQKRYDTGPLAKKLGNSPEADGDGYKYRGRTGIQITGKSNYQQFFNWCYKQGFNPPDFVKFPDRVNDDPWEGLAPLWYWTTRKLNDYADNGDIEQITKIINGGRNGLDDRISRYETIGLKMLGYEAKSVESVKAFQTLAQAEGFLPPDEPGKPPQVDGDIGAKTRAAIHQYLVRRGTVPVAETKAAPVTEVVPVIPKGGDKKALNRVAAIASTAAVPALAFVPDDPWFKLAFVGIAIVGIAILIWRAESIASRIKVAAKAFGLSDE